MQPSAGKQIMVKPTTPPKPDKYDAEIKYIESTGTQWIDTGIKCDSNVGFEIKFSGVLPNEQSYGFVIGCQDDNYAKCVVIEDSDSSTYYCGNGTSTDFVDRHNISVNSIVTASLYYLGSNELVLDVDGEVTKAQGHIEPSVNANLGLFCMITPDGEFDLAKVRVYECKISKGNEIIMDLIPVRVGDAGYLYDTISKTLLGDDAHPLIAGPDVK